MRKKAFFKKTIQTTLPVFIEYEFNSCTLPKS